MNELFTYFTRNVLQLVIKKGVCVIRLKIMQTTSFKIQSRLIGKRER